MTVVFDAATRRLRLDQGAFDTLVAIAAGADADPRRVEELKRAGVVDADGQVSTDLGLASVADPTAVAKLTMVSDTGRSITGQAWVAPAGATYLMSTADDQLEVIRSEPSYFPISIARVVGLGPRPRSGVTRWTLPPESVDDLVSADAERRQRVCDLLVEDATSASTQSYVQQLATGPWWYWALQVQWPAAHDSPGIRAIHVMDSQAGLLVMSEAGESVALEAITPTEIWQLLTMILPGDPELAFGGAAAAG